MHTVICSKNLFSWQPFIRSASHLGGILLRTQVFLDEGFLIKQAAILNSYCIIHCSFSEFSENVMLRKNRKSNKMDILGICEQTHFIRAVFRAVVEDRQVEGWQCRTLSLLGFQFVTWSFQTCCEYR